MKLEHSFRVQASPADAWELLQDVPRVIPCMPGAELVEARGPDAWVVVVTVKFGPVALAFDVDVTRTEIDVARHRVVLSADARERRARGRGQAVVESTLAPDHAGGAAVTIVTDLTLAGPVAQYGRGMVQDVSRQMVQEFAACIEARLDADTGAARHAEPESERATTSLSGRRLVAIVVLGWLRRLRELPGVRRAARQK